MMQVENFRNKCLKTILSIPLIFIFVNDVAFSKNNTLKLIKDYLEDIRSIEATFSQTDYTGDIMTGDLFLKKPGKIRLSYNPPHKLQIVSKQKAVLIFDPKNNGSGPLTYPMSSTPLGFLIKNDLSPLIDEDGKIFELGDRVFLNVHKPRYKLSIEFNKNPISLIGWEFQNQMGETIKITLNIVKKNKFISDEIFKLEKDFGMVKK